MGVLFGRSLVLVIPPFIDVVGPFRDLFSAHGPACDPERGQFAARRVSPGPGAGCAPAPGSARSTAAAAAPPLGVLEEQVVLLRRVRREVVKVVPSATGLPSQSSGC